MPPPRLASALLFLTLLLSQAVQAAPAPQTAPPPLPRPGTAVHFTHLTSDDGLAQNTVNDILQDQRGFIWVATTGGLSRYDGYRFTTYRHDPNNPNSLSANWVRDLYEDPTGILWIGTEGGGVARFDPATETFTRFAPALQTPGLSDRILKIFQDPSGQFWFAGAGPSGLTQFAPSTQAITRYPLDPSHPTAFQGLSVEDMVEDETGLWLASTTVLARYTFATEQFTYYAPPNPNENRLIRLVQDATGQVWAGGALGLYRFDVNRQALVAVLSFTDVTALTTDGAGYLWVAARGGLVIVDPSTETTTFTLPPNPQQRDGLTSGALSTLYFDRAGVLWIGTRDAGLNLYDPRQARFAHYRHDPEQSATLPEGPIGAIAVNDDQHLWLTVGPSLNRLNTLTGEVTTYPNPDAPDPISAIFQDHTGTVWVASSALGLHTFNLDTERFTPYPLQSALTEPTPPKAVVDFYEDADNALWLVVNTDGVYRLDAARQDVQFYAGPTAPPIPGLSGPLPRPPITDLFADAAGQMWLTTLNGLYRFDPRTGQHQPHRLRGGTGPDSYIETGLADAAGLLWLASREGVIRFDPFTNSAMYYTEAHGLPSAWVVGVLVDDAGHFWFSTKKGLSRFNPIHQTFRNFDLADGLPGNEFAARSLARLPTGELAFGGMSGLSLFNPAHIRADDYQAPVVLTQFSLAGHPVLPSPTSLLTQAIGLTPHLTLTHDQNTEPFEFEFAALSYAAAHKNQYRYILEGFDADWHTRDSALRVAPYTNLPAGRYTLRVQASNSDGVWSSEEATLTLTILPAWWETWWFRLMALIGAVSLIVIGVRWRIISTEARNRWLETQVASRTRELTERSEQLAYSNAELVSAKERAEAASRAKSEFLSNMSHELRTPLNGILGYAQILLRHPDLSVQQRDGLTTIHNSGKHLLTLINDVLDLAKIEARQLELRPAELHLPSFLDSLVNLMLMAAQQKSLQLVYAPDAHLPACVWADEKRLRQVLLNLLGNAIKFTEQGQVTFRVNAVSAQPASVTVRFAVQDTGVGIASTDLSKIFEPFEQVGDARQRSAGTGLGLAISQQLVTLMGGHLRAHSTLGEGSVFDFEATFPLATLTAPTSAPAPQKITGYAGPRRRVLVVDDRPENRFVLLDLLQPLGFEVTLAENGQLGVERARAQPPDMILMDLVMPVMMGFEAVSIVRQTPALAHLPIIAVSASAHEMDREASRRVGCDDFLPKPVEAERLFDLLQHYLNLTWTYAETETLAVSGPAQPSPPTELVPPPREELEAIYELARFGNMERLRERAHHLAALSDQYRPFAHTLRRLAEDFDDQAIQELAKRYLQ